MSRTGIRFRPPSLALSPEVRWLLLRAFGPSNARFEEPVAGERAVELARLFEISARIAQRRGRDALAGDLGEEHAAELMGDLRGATFVVLRRVAAIRDVARIAAELGIELVLLKFLALHFSRVTPVGSREAADIDILVSHEHSARLYDALGEAGYASKQLSPSDHHLPLLDHPKLGPVEIHRFVPGVTVEGESHHATLRSLEAGSLLEPVPELPGRCFVPLLEVQAAHAIVHGVVQHGSHPDAYSAARMLSDLVDLQAACELGDGIFDKAYGWIAGAVSRSETTALRDLCRSLVAGVVPSGDEASTEAVFLRHIVAGLLDDDYRRALNLRFLEPRLTNRSQVLALGAIVRRAFFPTRGELDRIYGPPKGSAGYLARRLMRPFDVFRRLLRDSLGPIRLRLKQRRRDDC